MTVYPKFESISVYVNGVYKPPGSYSVKKGAVMRFTVDISGYDGSFFESTKVCAWLLDKNTGKKVWSSIEFKIYKDEIEECYGSLKIEKNMDLVFQTAYWNGIRWIISDQSKEWKFSVSHQSQPSGHPVPKINHQQTFFLIPPDYEKYCYPGTYTVKKGSKVLFELAVDNKSSNAGKCYGALINENGKAVWSKVFSVKYPNEGVALTGDYFVNEDTTLKFQTWWWDGKGWKFCDEYGKWVFKIEHAQPSKPPYPVIDRQKTYILLNGRRLPNPPCDVKVSGKAELEAVLTVVNKGGSGKCKFAAYDSLKGVKLGEYVKTIPAGATVEVRGRMTVTRDIGFKWLVYRWNNGEWEFMDDMG